MLATVTKSIISTCTPSAFLYEWLLKRRSHLPLKRFRVVVSVTVILPVVWTLNHWTHVTKLSDGQNSGHDRRELWTCKVVEQRLTRYKMRWNLMKLTSCAVITLWCWSYGVVCKVQTAGCLKKVSTAKIRNHLRAIDNVYRLWSPSN